MKTTGMKDRGVLERVGDQMTQAQALRLKTLADEAYQLGSTRPISPSKRRRVALMRSTLRSRLPTRSRRYKKPRMTHLAANGRGWCNASDSR